MTEKLQIPIDIYHPDDGLTEIENKPNTIITADHTPPDVKVSIVGFRNNQVNLEIWYSPTPKIKSLGEMSLGTDIEFGNQPSEILPEELEYSSLTDASRRIGFAVLKHGLLKKAEN